MSNSSNSIPRIRVLVVRHGETKENVDRVIQGQLDTDLNERGRDQARRTAEALKDERIDEIYSSPLKRAKDGSVKTVMCKRKPDEEARAQRIKSLMTAEAIRSLQSSNPSFILDDRIQERGFGSLEGKVYSGSKRDSIEGIESMNALTERLASFWNDLISGQGPWNHQDATQTNGSSHEVEPSSNGRWKVATERTILLVSHGAALSALLNEVLLSGGYLVLANGATPSRFWNCSITEVFIPTISTPVSSSQSSLSAGHISRRNKWTVRPSHLNPRSNSKKSKNDAADSEWADLEDIGFGPGISICKKWADVRHLPEFVNGPGASSAAVKNVDEMVGKETKDE